MNDSVLQLDTTIKPSGLSLSRQAVQCEILYLTEKLLELLESRFSREDPNICSAIDFLNSYIQHHSRIIATHCQSDLANKGEDIGLYRLKNVFRLSQTEIQIVVLSGMAQEHEAFADIFRSLHPNSHSYPTAALLLQLIGIDDSNRQDLFSMLTNSKLVTNRIIKIEGESPIFASSMIIEANDWLAIATGNAHLPLTDTSEVVTCDFGLNTWLDSPLVNRAKLCVQQNEDAIILLHSAELGASINRAILIGEYCQRKLLKVEVNPTTSKIEFNKIALHCLVANKTPLLICKGEGLNEKSHYAHLTSLFGCVLICHQQPIDITCASKFTVELNVDRLGNKELISMWQQLLPSLTKQAAQLATRFPLDPYVAKQRVEMLKVLVGPRFKESSIEEISTFFKQHAVHSVPAGLKRVTPNLNWMNLILPKAQKQQLDEAINRLVLQQKVLDEWQFLENRRGAKGVRLLFSGSPGTGKTLAAEVLANALGVDLLIVDLASVVSKWIGETEKNLAKIFSFAEQSHAVLFFDEADAIFGKRTEVNDSHDRYANLETAYLLTRVEAYDGMAILATNYKNNIDAAFVRRLDYIVDFREPDSSDRERLWRCHVPEKAPIHTDVDFKELANLYPMVGGEIRNAAVSAAYFAAQQDVQIKQDHFINAIRREYEKTGKAFREVNSF